MKTITLRTQTWVYMAMIFLLFYSNSQAQVAKVNADKPYSKDYWIFVDKTYKGSSDGSFLAPYTTLDEAISSPKDSITVWLQPGTYYISGGKISRRMIIKAPLGGVSIRGSQSAPDRRDDAENLSNEVTLEQNYPNPFNPSTTINFALPQKSKVSLKVFDIIGRLVTILVDGNLQPGVHNFTFDARNLPSGVYFYQLNTSSFSQIKRMTLMK